MRNKDYNIEEETAEELAKNPFIRSFYYHYNFYEEIPKLGKAVEKLKEEENFSKSKILFAMFEYAKIYEQFRPIKITKNNVYFGTVDKMNSIYFTLFKYTDADLLIIFSRFTVTDLHMKFKNAPKRRHKDIDWDELINDIKDIDKAILTTIESQAVDLYCIIRSNAPSYIETLVKGFILRFSENIKKEDIDFRGDSILIKNKKLAIKNNYQLSDAIFEIDERLKNKKGA